MSQLRITVAEERGEFGNPMEMERLPLETFTREHCEDTAD
jgi:hypothetical protein